MVLANNYQKEAFISFNRDRLEKDVEHYDNGINKFSIMRLSDDFKQDSNGGTYIINNN